MLLGLTLSHCGNDDEDLLEELKEVRCLLQPRCPTMLATCRLWQLALGRCLLPGGLVEQAGHAQVPAAAR